MSSSTARIVAAVLAVPALLWALALVVVVTADLPPLGGAAAGAPIAGVALLSLLGAVAASIAARLGREHRGDAPPRRLRTVTITGTAVVAVSALALALGGAVNPEPAVAESPRTELNQTEPNQTEQSETELSETEPSIVFGDHSGHVGYEP